MLSRLCSGTRHSKQNKAKAEKAVHPGICLKYSKAYKNGSPLTQCSSLFFMASHFESIIGECRNLVDAVSSLLE